MPKFIYVSDNRITITSNVDTINFTCVSEQLNITGVTVTPSTASVVWTQVAGSTVNIINPTTANPTIVFPPGFNTAGGQVILKISAIGANDSFLTINVNTRIQSDHSSNTSAVGLKRNTFLPLNSIPSELNYYYADYYPENSSVTYQTNQNLIQATYKKPTQYLDLKIDKVEWLQNINGIYTLVNTTIEPNRGFNYSRYTNTKAKIYYTLTNNKKEVVETDILTNELLKSTASLGVSNYVTNANTSISKSLVNIYFNNYLLNIIETIKIYEDTHESNTIGVVNKADVLITKNNYLLNTITTPSTYQEEYIDAKVSTSINSSVNVLITKNSYIFNNSGITIG